MRGVYEHPKGSGVWWICYFVEGKRRREKVGRKSDAKDLYQSRKADARAGVKLPALRNHRGVTIGELIDDALEFVSDHKDLRNYVSKAAIVRHAMGHRPALSLKPQELDTWLKTQCKTPATANRYKAFISLCYREGMTNEKVSVNPARLVRHRKEPKGRYRFLSREEYQRLYDVISKRFPEHLAEFIVSVHTGMRLAEQYSLKWRQMHSDRRTIELVETKNTEPRTVHLNQIALDALVSVKPTNPKPNDLIFKSATEDYTQRAWFEPCVAEAKITDYTWHNNRHTFGSWLAMAGASIKEIQEAGGWKTITMAARYAHLSPKHKESVVERLILPQTEATAT